MAILYGTTADGDSLPVEVNEFGQLIAQGLDGPTGPPGPPGIGQLPPDPFEGALLGWEDGQLAWVGGSIPLPPGTFGPILSYADGLITLAEEVSLLNGQAVFLSDAAGNRFYYEPTALVTAVSGDVYTVNTDFDMWQVGDVVGDVSFCSVLYTGNGASQSVTTGFSPDFVWLKGYTDPDRHGLFDTVRGARERLQSAEANSEDTVNGVISFNSDGFDVGDYGETNAMGRGYVAWCWDAGGTTVTNNEGTIASQVRSNGNFSVVSYTGNTSAGATFGHGLTIEPSLVIVKRINATGNWSVYSKSVGAGDELCLNTVDTASTTPVWNNTLPNASVITVASDNNSSNDYIAYCWAESPTQSFGKYTGAGSGNDVPITTGFEPAFLLTKPSGDGGDWVIWDDARSSSNPNTANLYANKNAAENPSGYFVDFNSNGFTILGNVTGASHNKSGVTYIYAAFSRQTRSTVTDINAEAGTLTIDGDPFLVGDVVSAGVKSGEGSVLATVTDSIVLRADNTEWLPGQYVTAPEQEIAARKVASQRLRKRYSK